MKKYRFVGCAQSQIIGTPYTFSQYGQLVAMTDEMAVLAVSGHIPLVRDEDFTPTAAEVSAYSKFESQNKATPEFVAKRAAMWELASKYHEHAESILTSTTQQEEPTNA